MTSKKKSGVPDAATQVQIVNIDGLLILDTAIYLREMCDVFLDVSNEFVTSRVPKLRTFSKKNNVMMKVCMYNLLNIKQFEHIN